MKNLPERIEQVAASQVGVRETKTNGGPQIAEYQMATWLPVGEWPWCAAFICWVVRESMKAANVPETDTFKRPTTAGAWALEHWSLKQDNSTWTKKKPFRDILPGDIIVFNFSHCGIAVSECDDTGFFQTVEGNTDDGGGREGGAVLRRWRRSSQVRSRIRFRV